MAPTASFAGFAINGIDPDPAPGQPVCTQGGATGNRCGAIKVPGVKPATLTTQVPSWQPGDDGAPVTVDGQLVGMTRQGYTIVDVVVPRIITHVRLTLSSAILDDANAKGGPGAGFTPIPA